MEWVPQDVLEAVGIPWDWDRIYRLAERVQKARNN